jgi:hypothetical protein
MLWISSCRRLTAFTDRYACVQPAPNAQFDKTLEYPNHWTAPFIRSRPSDELALLGRPDLLKPETWHDRSVAR